MPPPHHDIVKLLETKRAEIRGLLIHPTLHRKTFIQDTNWHILWSRNDVQAVFSQWHPSEIERLRDLYIISFTILVYNGWTPNGTVFRRAFFSKPELVDAKLPFNAEDLAELGENDPNARNAFLERQYIFRPCIISKRKQAHIDYLDPNQPWPFLEPPISIGSGAFGKVLQARVAKGYYKVESDFEHMSNTNEKLVAFKEFKDVKHGQTVVKDGRKDFLKEVKSLDFLRESLVDQTHIAVHLAAIVRGPKFYLFLELTELGDLEVLLNGGNELRQNSWDTRDGDRKYRFDEKFPNARKVNFVEELEALARALDYLHKRLPKGIYCSHFDLKPRNILVYPRNTGGANVGRWVLTDFGISSFERREPNDKSFETPTIADVANLLESEEAPSRPSYLIGPHRAPELHKISMLERGSNDKCDIWSFVCIASEVFAFLIGGLDSSDVKAATDTLWDLRKAKKSPDGEYWFQHTTPDASRSEVKLNQSVSDWFSRVLRHVDERQPHHAAWTGQFRNFLDDSLKINPSDRPSASTMYKQLGKIINIMNSAPPNSAQYSALGSRYLSSIREQAYNFINTEFDQSSSGQYSDAIVSLMPDRNTHYPLSHMSALPENVISSSGSERSGPSDRSSIFSEGRISRRSRSPSSTFERTELSGQRPGIDAKDWRFSAPKKIKEFAISPDGEIAAFLHGPDSRIQLSVLNLREENSICETLSNIQMPSSIKWDRLVVTSQFLIASGGEGKGRNGCLVNLSTRQQLFIPPEGKWPQPCRDMTPSKRGFFVWRFSQRGIRMWNSCAPNTSLDPRQTTIIEREFNQEIEHICFNTSGTCLFVWTQNAHTHYLHTINMLNPTTHTLYTDTFPVTRTATFIWPAQSDHACVVRESAVGPPCYFRPDETNRSAPRVILNANIDPESSITAVCNNWMVTAEIKGIRGRLRLTKHYIRPTDDAANNGTGEIQINDSIRPGSLNACRLAACEVQTSNSQGQESQGRDRVIVCMENGRVWRFESPANERTRPRVGSFGMVYR